MCEIFGHVHLPNHDSDRSRSALNELTHRGPDQWGEFYDDYVYSGHRRLSILDTSENGRQPMTDQSQTIVISVNGEIYNFLELKKQLVHDYPFKSTSDSEVLLYGYKAWGLSKLLEYIDGMYAAVIYDRIQKKVILIRDRAGIKPIYYGKIDKYCIWASELKAIKKFDINHHLKLDNTALYVFLTYRYIPTPKSLFTNIFKLEPGHYVIIDIESGQIQKKKYWQLQVKEKNISIQNACESLRYLIGKSVSEQLVSDVPVGFFLSGGLDSSSVVQEACQVSDRIKSFSIGFDVSEYDETHYAQIMANHCNTKHQKEILHKNAPKALLKHFCGWYDEPFADSSAFPTYLVCQYARKDVTVALSGDGGDEILGGYQWYNDFPLFPKKSIQNNTFFSLLPLLMDRLNHDFVHRQCYRLNARLMALRRGFPGYAKIFGGLTYEEKKRYRNYWQIHKDYNDYWYFQKFDRPDLPHRTRLQYIVFHTFIHDDVLTKVDRVSMAVSLEVRVPLLSREIIEFCFSLPEKNVLRTKN
jgi:asparagine synthase (glutamine-hydrolysing)